MRGIGSAILFPSYRRGCCPSHSKPLRQQDEELEHGSVAHNLLYQIDAPKRRSR
jgi:hypothetical protein